MSLVVTPIDSTPRKLNTQWTTETADDLREMFGIATVIGCWFAKEPSISDFKFRVELMMLEGRQYHPAELDYVFSMLFDGCSHEQASHLLQRVDILPNTWQYHCWINPDAALQNPVLPLWLLENGNFLFDLPLATLKFLVASSYFPAGLRQSSIALWPELKEFQWQPPNQNL